MEEHEVKRNMADDFNYRLVLILEQIDNYKQRIIKEPQLLFYLNERINAWYMKIKGKMIVQKLMKDVQMQDELRNKIIAIPKPIFQDHRLERSGQWCVKKEYWKQYWNLLEQREEHLNVVMEKLGLTNVSRRGGGDY